MSLTFNYFSYISPRINGFENWQKIPYKNILIPGPFPPMPSLRHNGPQTTLCLPCAVPRAGELTETSSRQALMFRKPWLQSECKLLEGQNYISIIGSLISNICGLVHRGTWHWWMNEWLMRNIDTFFIFTSSLHTSY